jgi:hypothetical protein
MASNTGKTLAELEQSSSKAQAQAGKASQEQTTAQSKPEDSKLATLQADLAKAQARTQEIAKAMTNPKANHLELSYSMVEAQKAIATIEQSITVATYDKARPDLMIAIAQAIKASGLPIHRLHWTSELVPETGKVVEVLKINEESTTFRTASSSKPSVNWTNGTDTKPVKELALSVPDSVKARVQGTINAGAWANVIKSAQAQGYLTDWHPVS